LAGLKENHKCFDDTKSEIRISINARTLLKTDVKLIKKVVESGFYVHVGLKKQLLKIASKYLKNVRSFQLLINIDGLSLFRSSSDQVYIALRARYVIPFNYTWINAIYILHYYYYIINPSIHNCVSKYAMIAAHKVNAARELIGIAEKQQQYFCYILWTPRFFSFKEIWLSSWFLKESNEIYLVIISKSFRVTDSFVSSRELIIIA